MPHDSNAPIQPLLVNIKTGQEPKTKYVNNLDAVNIKILHAPSQKELESYLPEFASGTWCDEPKTEFTDEERSKVIDDLFAGYILPTALETIKITFLVEGLDLVDVCHVIRHRTLSFSAQGTGDRDLRHDDILVKPSILNSKHFEKYKKLMELSKELYCDITDDEDMPILDARTVLPRSYKNYYYVSGDMKAMLAFVRQRKDESIEPESINVMAIKLWIELVKLYPSLKGLIDLRSPDHFAIETSKGGRSSNFYSPEPKNDIYDYNKASFMRQKMRCEMIGGSDYIKIRDKLLLELDQL